ncbi:hypothetical protein [Lactobacillus gasseri]|uniref:hypothetical protein n=1 Tax=Lactobacillus gasseri TaxID=1596 RepID=UPI00118F226C|nr:hypothetical protein [Lactobacillus gasseri]TVV16661.1 hypothetical protein FOF66_04830 [Lactobacillus gasseri]
MNNNIDNKEVYVRTKTCLIWNIVGLVILLLSFTIIALPEIVILLITLIKRKVKVYSLKENNYLIISKKAWKEYKRINNIGFWKQYSLISVTKIIHQHYSNVVLEKTDTAIQGKSASDEIKDIAPVNTLQSKRDLKNANINITECLDKSIENKKTNELNENNRFKFVKARLTDRANKQNVAQLNKIKLLSSERQKYNDLQNKIKLENNGEANFGVDFKNKVIFIDKLYESKGFDEFSFEDLSDVKVDEKNLSNINFVKKDGSEVQASFIKFPVSEEEKNLDSIILKNLVLKIKSKIS